MESAQLDLTFAALSDPTRRAILARLASGDTTVNELAAPFDLTQPAISKHLKVLENAGLVTKRRRAQQRPCSIRMDPLLEAIAWIDAYRQVWEANFERLDSLLDAMTAERDDSTSNGGSAS